MRVRRQWKIVERIEGAEPVFDIFNAIPEALELLYLSRSVRE